MNPIRRRLLAYHLNHCQGVGREELIPKLYPYMILHNITLEKTEIRFDDENMGITMKLDQYRPTDTIPYAAIAEVREMYEGNCLRILLRSGEFHILEKNSGKRSQRNIYTEPRAPYPGELHFWAMWRATKRLASCVWGYRSQ